MMSEDEEAAMAGKDESGVSYGDEEKENDDGGNGGGVNVMCCAGGRGRVYIAHENGST